MRSILWVFPSVVTALALCTAPAAMAADTSTVTVRPTVQDSTTAANTRTEENRSTYQLSQQELAQLWGLSMDEIARATALLQGPRAAFSVANLSPIEALGIHARSDAERVRYAELFVRALHQDTERVVAWTRAAEAAKKRFYPNDMVVSFEGMPPIQADPAEAALLNIPRSAVKPAPPKSPVR